MKRNCFLALTFAVSMIAPGISPSRALAEAPPGAVTSFAPVVEKVARSVVTIYSSKTVRRSRPNADEQMMRRFFGMPDAPEGRGKQEGLGSGVVLSADGYILTNNHVIEGADEILVSFGIETKEYKARKIGSDPRTDLALLKIDAKDLTPATFGDSSKLRVGDIVLAIGNPFGLRQSVSMGIVSALGRSGMRLTTYEDFIQTDAAINMGNSGGALVDANGNLIGINTAIFSPSGGNNGIGFAVPVNLAHNVFEKLRDKGRVIRGYLGINLQALTPELVDAFKLTDINGALVADVVSDSPAAKAGIKVRDIITAVNGEKVADSRDLQFKISGMEPGKSVDLALIRDGKEQKVAVTLGELPGDDSRIAGANSDEEKHNVLDGITVGALDDEARKRFRIPAGVDGALITNLEPDSAGANAGLQPGDVVQEINRTPIKDADEAIAVSNKVGEKEKALLRIWSRGSSRYVVLDNKE